MRIAFIADIHGNPIALDAVLADAASLDVDSYWVLGDVAAIGYDPIGVLERLTALEKAAFVQGNTERYLITGELPGPGLEDVRAAPDLVAEVVEVAASFAWTQGCIAAHRWYDWLDGLPLERRLELPDGRRLLAVHVAPGRDDGEGFHSGQDERALRELVGDCDADLLIVGHTHQVMDRQIGPVRVVNVGSVSNPFAPDLRASYVLLEAGVDGYSLQHCYVDYDHRAVIEAVRQSRHPSADYILQFQRGQKYPGWYCQQKPAAGQ